MLTISFSSFATICIVVAVAAAAFSTAAVRRPVLVRFYALSSLALAALAARIAYIHGEFHFYLIAVAVVLLKVLALPIAVVYVAKRYGITERSVSYLRPASQFFLTAAVLVGLYFFVRRSPFSSHAEFATLFGAVALVGIGLTMLTVRRDIFSQIFGFLTLENGITLFAIATLGSIPLLIEGGIFLAVAAGGFLMAGLLRRVQEVHGTADVSLLRELVE